ncbi:MAG TPA: hypothetical protein DCS93_27955 [Microscillaceae bacterium]|nr:hypothetical protein [Microscillaceae bacterium]
MHLIRRLEEVFLANRRTQFQTVTPVLLLKLNNLQMKKIIYPFLLLIISLQLGYAQVGSGSLEDYLDDYVTNLPGNDGNDYVQPTNAQLNDWGTMIGHILGQDIVAARALAAPLNYRIVEYTNTDEIPNQVYYVLEEKSPRVKHWGVYVFNSSPCRQTLNLQAPHPKADFRTEKQAIYCFTRLNAHSLFIAGARRCNHQDLSNCSGTTKVCTPQQSNPFRISDVAHNVGSAFQKATEILLSEQPETIFVQLHGFAKKSSDPYVIISNGTKYLPITDYASLIKDELLIADPTLTFKVPHIDLTWNRLIGSTNTQGRLINGSNNPCNVSAVSATGQFVHIEQEKFKLRNDVTGWDKMYNALSNVFPCLPLANARISRIASLPKVYPNPTVSRVFTIEGSSITGVVVTNINGETVWNENYSNQSKIQIDLSKFSKGMYFITIEANHQRQTQKLILK